jgi:hypothetical protein
MSTWTMSRLFGTSRPYSTHGGTDRTGGPRLNG